MKELIGRALIATALICIAYSLYVQAQVNRWHYCKFIDGKPSAVIAFDKVTGEGYIKLMHLWRHSDMIRYREDEKKTISEFMQKYGS